MGFFDNLSRKPISLRSIPGKLAEWWGEPDPEIDDPTFMPTKEEVKNQKIDDMVREMIENPSQEDIDYATQDNNTPTTNKTSTKKTSTQHIDPNDLNLLDFTSTGNQTINENLPLLVNPNQPLPATPSVTTKHPISGNVTVTPGTPATEGLQTSDWADNAFSDEDMAASLTDEPISNINKDVVPPSEIIAHSEKSPIPHEKYLPESPKVPSDYYGGYDPDELYDEPIDTTETQLETFDDWEEPLDYTEEGGAGGGGYADDDILNVTDEDGNVTQKTVAEINNATDTVVPKDERGWFAKTFDPSDDGLFDRLDPSGDGLLNKENRRKMLGKLTGLLGKFGPGADEDDEGSAFTGGDYLYPTSTSGGGGGSKPILNPIQPGGWTQSQNDFMQQLYNDLNKKYGGKV